MTINVHQENVMSAEEKALLSRRRTLQTMFDSRLKQLRDEMDREFSHIDHQITRLKARQSSTESK